MKEIKFRAWNPSNKHMQTTHEKWSGDVFIRLNGEKVICVDTGEWEQGMSVAFMKDNLDLILMQYTGLKDKNGKEIYEGDICTQTFGGEPQEKGIVTIEITRGVMVGNKPVWHHNVEIIGNIYENPELYQTNQGKV